MRKKPITYSQDNNIPPFTILDVFLSSGLIVLVLFLIQLNSKVVELFFLSLPVERSVRILFLFLLQELLLLLPIFYLIYIRYKTSLRTGVSLYFIPVFSVIKSVLKWYVLYLLFSFVLAYWMYLSGIRIPGYGEGKDIIPIFGHDSYSLIIVIIVIVGVAPIVEEVFFRGFMFLTLYKKWGYLGASVLAAAIFASVHLDFGAFFPRFILGLILNQLVIEKGISLYPAILFHIVNNGIALSMQLWYPG